LHAHALGVQLTVGGVLKALLFASLAEGLAGEAAGQPVELGQVARVHVGDVAAEPGIAKVRDVRLLSCSVHLGRVHATATQRLQTVPEASDTREELGERKRAAAGAGTVRRHGVDGARHGAAF